MIFSVIESKYKCDCGRGLAKYEEPEILDKINKLAEWRYCRFPRTLSKEKTVQHNGESVTMTIYYDNPEFLGESPELKPGDCIVFNGQSVAINSPNSLVLIISETSANSLERAVKEVINAEWSIREQDFSDIETFTETIVHEIPEKYNMFCPIDYPTYRILYDSCYNGRWEDSDWIEVEIKLRDDWTKNHLLIGGWGIRYRNTEFDETEEDFIKELALKSIGLLYKKYPRQVDPFKLVREQEEQMQIEKQLASH